jgi:hypothetical protein
MKPPFVVTTSLSKEFGGIEMLLCKNIQEVIDRIIDLLYLDETGNRLVEIKIEPQENYE